LAVSPLHAIVDLDAASRAGWTPVDLARALLDGGAPLVQLRVKQLPSGAFLDLCDAVVALAEPYRADVIVNDRADLARLSGASGVHVGQEDLPPAAARRLLGDAAVIGFSTHNVPQIEAALREPISYLAVGPVFGTSTKDTGYSAVGLDLVRTAARLAGAVPVVGIGGITVENASSVIAAGASAVAVIGALLIGGDPARRTRAFLQSLAHNRV
jgi:thiamine-phosphate pyrophosphorylase